MALELKSGQTVRVTINKAIQRQGARKTLIRLFMQDKTIRQPIEDRSSNFKELPKRRGGQIWTKRPNKVFPRIERGAAATIRTTPQTIRDLRSVEEFIQVA